jgi:hypothetical protein
MRYDFGADPQSLSPPRRGLALAGRPVRLVVVARRFRCEADLCNRRIFTERFEDGVLAGTDFFTAEVLTLRGLVTYYVLFFIHLESRRVDIAGIIVHPDEPWMKQIARNVTIEGCGALRDCRYLLHDRDSKYTESFRAIIASGRIEPLALLAR